MQDSLSLIAAFIGGTILGAGVGVGSLRVLARARSADEAALADKFKALAADTLRANNEAFIHLAESRLKQSEQSAAATLSQKTTAMDELIKPMKETLGKLDQQVQALEIKREGAYRELSNMVKAAHEAQQQLRGETSQLLQALRTPTSRGAWGQMQLRRILEMTGMAAHTRDFTEQKTITAADGVLRPDCVVALPGNRCVVFDSKVPLSAYLDATQSENSAQQQILMNQHAKQVREHVRALGGKAYWSLIEGTPEFVVLFIPGDHLLGAALDCDPSLMDYAVEQRVVLATPTTVIALLWAVAYGWKQEALGDNVRRIGELGGELYGALSTMTRYFTDLGTKLTGSVKAYNETLGSLNRNVLSKARKLRDYGSDKDGKSLPEELEPLEIQARIPADGALKDDAA